jgi:hypothetical protein
MFYFYTNKLGFHPKFLGELKFIYALASISAMVLYNRYLKTIPFKKQFVVSSLLAIFLGYSQILLVTR